MYNPTNHISFSLLIKRSVLLAFFMLLLIHPYNQKSLFAQERIAVISKFTGDIKVLHEGKELAVKKVGPRILNSSLSDGDTLITGKGATVEILYADGSTVKVEENASLDLGTKELSEDEQAVTGKSVARVITIKSGKVWGSINKSKTVLTEFETPSGVAMVRGTEIGLDVDPDTSVVSIELPDGSMQFVSPGEQATFTMDSGEQVTIGVDADTGQISMDVGAGDIEVQIGGVTVNMVEGSSVEMNLDSETGEITVAAVEGDITIETGAGTVMMGAGDKVAIGETETGKTTVAVVEGDITIETDVGTIKMEAGDKIEADVDAETGEATILVTDGEVSYGIVVGTGGTFKTKITPPAPAPGAPGEPAAPVAPAAPIITDPDPDEQPSDIVTTPVAPPLAPPPADVVVPASPSS